MKVKKTLAFIFSICVVFLYSNCNTNAKSEISLQKSYGADSNYFIGLRAVENKNNKLANRYFDKSISKGSKYIKRRSIEQKIMLGNIQQQIDSAKKYLDLYNDDAALLFACKIFFENKEFSLLINYTNAIDISTCPNELAKMRLLSMQKKEDSRLLQETSKWFTQRKINQEHLDFYNDYLFEKVSNVQIDIIEPVERHASKMLTFGDYNSKLYTSILLQTIRFRVACAKKDYSSAYDDLNFIKEYCVSKNVVPLTKFLVADIGKVYLFVSRKYSENANYFLELAKTNGLTNQDIKYYSFLYAGRIFDKSSSYFSKAESAFLDAMKCAPTPEDYDMALWFLLNSKLTIDTESFVSSLEKYCSTWNNPYYFSDLLDNVSLLIFTGAKWKLFPKIYKIIDGHADNASTSKFAYLTARLIDTKFLQAPEFDETEKINAYKKAYSLNAGTDIYYRILAAKELKIPLEEFEKMLFIPEDKITNNLDTTDKEAQILLQGYADFGFVDLIYPEWQYFRTQNKNAFNIDSISKVAAFLKSCGTSHNNYFYKSLHMISNTANLDNTLLSKDIFKLVYPDNFLNEISKTAKEFNVEEYDMLGLIRTESFFNPLVESTKGAMGLSQLMIPTFEECVKKLKIQDAQIADPYTNIRVGTFYYSNLVHRLNNSDILALFAYNAGATKVRRWLQTSKVGLGIYKDLPSDLFLETIPISETRNYGRKVIQSAAIYAWLYYDKSPYDIINEMM